MTFKVLASELSVILKTRNWPQDANLSHGSYRWLTHIPQTLPLKYNERLLASNPQEFAIHKLKLEFPEFTEDSDLFFYTILYIGGIFFFCFLIGSLAVVLSCCGFRSLLLILLFINYYWFCALIIHLAWWKLLVCPRMGNNENFSRKFLVCKIVQYLGILCKWITAQ